MTQRRTPTDPQSSACTLVTPSTPSALSILSAFSNLRVLSLSLSVLLFATGCSTVPRDSQYRILVDVVTNPSGATFLGPGRVPHTTPAQIAIREDHSLSIVLKKEGYEFEQVQIGPRSRPKNLDPGNPLFYDIAASFVIFREISRELSGANSVLVMSPNPVNIDLTPSDGSLPSFPPAPRFVKASDLSCERPILLSEDCAGVMRGVPTRRLHVRGLDVRVAGSSSGKEVLVTHDDVNPVTLGLYPDGYGPDACTRVLRQTLEYGAQLQHLTAVKSGDVTHGCYLEFNENVYDSLKSLTIKE